MRNLKRIESLRWLIPLIIIAPNLVMGQVGVNTTLPESTLDIRATNHQGANTATDGILTPRVSSLGVGGVANGQLIYLIADDTTNGFTQGFYYWDGTKWTRSMGEWVDNGSGYIYAIRAKEAGNDVVVTETGNIGVGRTTSIASKIDVKTTVEGGSLLKLEGNQAGSFLEIKDMTPSDYPTSLSGLGTTSDGIMMTTPFARNFVIQTQENDSTDGVHIINSTGAHIFTAAATGRVGIGGFSNPNYTLSVQGDINATGSVRSNGVALTSDRRLKRNIEPLVSSINKIMELNPVHYEKKNSINSNDYSAKEMGFIAQEIETVFPELVEESNDEDKILSIQYIQLIPVLVKALQEQQKEIAELKMMVKSK